MRVTYPTTPAQYFHLLRRQVHQTCRKPLVVMTPKSLLRNPAAISTREDLARGHFASVLDDSEASASAQRLIFCSGKLYYELVQRLGSVEHHKVALIRLEQFYPFPADALRDIMARYKNAREFLWVQEEPENMGGWQFVRSRLEALTGQPLRYVGRPAAASPATGYPKIYRRQQDALIDEAVGIEEADRAASAAAN
jgi:2-oxoglutarate dehydrogenase E1 component